MRSVGGAEGEGKAIGFDKEEVVWKKKKARFSFFFF